MTIEAPIDLHADEQRATRRNILALVKQPMALISAVVILIFVIIAIIQPWITPFPPGYVKLSLTNEPPFTSEFILGGDRFGRDILSRLLAGTRGALMSGVILTVVALSLGIIFGLIAGFAQGLTDVVIMWAFSVLLAAPGIIILIALQTVVGASMPVAIALMGVLTAPGVFLLVRSLSARVRSELYVDAARVSGLSPARIVAKHVLLAIKAPIIVLAAFLFAGALSVAAGLEFLGLGDREEPSWGGMLNDSFVNFYVAPVQLLWPALALGITMASFVLLGNAMRDHFERAKPLLGRRARRAQVKAAFDEGAVDRTFGAKTDTAAFLAATSSRPATSSQFVASAQSGTSPVLQIDDLRISYLTNGVRSDVVDGVTVAVESGQVVGLVGESGSGKTQTVLAALGLLPAEAVLAGGSIKLDGKELLGRSARKWDTVRGREVGYVPQEPMSNLDPTSKVGTQLVDGMVAHGIKRAEATKRSIELLDRVGIRDPRRTFGSYPFEISGGMAQRVLIAGAIATKPKLLIADEPTTALDVTVQAEVLELLRELQREMQMSMLIVTHNFGVVADICDRVVVMRHGRVVESGSVLDVFNRPTQDYTKVLLNAVLDSAPRRDQRSPVRRDVLQAVPLEN